MSVHPFNYRVDGTTLSTHVDSVRLAEGVAGKRADLIEIAYQHGAHAAVRHWTRPRLMRLHTLLKRGATPSDIFTGLYELEQLLMSGLPTLARNDPVNGEVQCEILVSDAVEQPDGSGRFGWTWPVWQVRGYWEDVALSTDTELALGAAGTIGPLTVGGNHPTDPKFTITCQTAGANPAIENPANLDKLSIAGSFVATDVIVIDVGASVEDDQVTLNGVRAKNLLRINRGFLLEFAEDTSISLDWTSDSGSWDVLTEWKDRHR